MAQLRADAITESEWSRAQSLAVPVLGCVHYLHCLSRLSTLIYCVSIYHSTLPEWAVGVSGRGRLERQGHSNPSSSLNSLPADGFTNSASITIPIRILYAIFQELFYAPDYSVWYGRSSTSFRLNLHSKDYVPCILRSLMKVSGL